MPNPGSWCWTGTRLALRWRITASVLGMHRTLSMAPGSRRRLLRLPVSPEPDRRPRLPLLGPRPHHCRISLNFPMPGGSIDLQRTPEPSSQPEAAPPKTESALLHRTPWTPPTAIRASGINIELEDGRQFIDAVGGASVACLGMGNQKVIDAITNQLGNLICKFIQALILFGTNKERRHYHRSPRGSGPQDETPYGDMMTFLSAL
jgi:hypothetical protein